MNLPERSNGFLPKAATLACLAICGFTSAAASAAEREWHTLSIEGQRVGYAWREAEARNGERIASEVMRVYVSQLQRSVAVETRTEVGRSAQGRPKWIRVQSVNGVSRRGWSARVSADGTRMSVTVEGAPGARDLALPANLVWPDEMPDALTRLVSDALPRTRFPVLDTASATVAESEVQLQTDGGGVARIRVSIPAAGNRPRVEWHTFDAQSRSIARERTFLGSPLSWQRCARDCDARVGQPFDVMARLVVSSPYRIPPNALDGPIRYVISREDGSPAQLPVTSEQSVVADGNRSVVTICSSCGDAAGITAGERNIYLASNAWVQADLPEIRAFARRHGGGRSPRATMTQLVDAVRNHMTGDVDYLGYATASEALASRSGDCTEFSVLLAAAARARGIPARIVVGLVYAGRFSGKKDVFSPHTWVQAWTGDRWESFDAGLERFDATHIALAIGDGNPRNMDAQAGLTGQWRIEKLGLVR